jgi:hypothetical protein
MLEYISLKGDIMDFKKNHLITRCRAILIESLAMINPELIDYNMFDDGSSLIGDLQQFCFYQKQATKNKRRDIYMFLYTFRQGRTRYYFENPQTIQELGETLAAINSNKDYIRLLDTVSQKQVDIVSNFATEFAQYLEYVRAVRMQNQRRLTQMLPQ